MEEKKTRKGTDKNRKEREIHIRITASELEDLEMASYERDMSKSDILRRALKMYLGGLKDSY